MAVTYGVNAVLNSGGETYSGTANGTNIIVPANWTANFSPTLAPWSSGNASSAAIPQPAGTGSVYFAGGPGQESSDFFQTIDLSNIGAAVDAGQVNFTLSALLGGTGSQNDNVMVFVNFQTSEGFFAGQSSIGPVTAANRNNASGLLSRTKTETVPTGARFAQVQIHFERSTPTYNDGYADNVSLVFNGPAVPTLVSSAYNVNTRAASFTFSQPLLAGSVAAGDLQVTNLTTNQTSSSATAATLSPDSKTVTFTLPTSLTDGNYRMRIPTGAVSSTGGQASSGNSDLNTFVLAGDVNRDKSVNFDDLLIIAQNYGQSNRTFSQGNINYSAGGVVNFDDLLLLAQRYGTSLATQQQTRQRKVDVKAQEETNS